MNLSFPAALSYGLAAAASFGFGLYLALSSRGSWRGWPLILAVMLGAVSAAAATLLLITGQGTWWYAYRAVDLAHTVAWLYLLIGAFRPAAAKSIFFSTWVTVTYACVAVIAVVQLAVAIRPPGIPYEGGVAAGVSLVGYLGLTVVGLLVIEAIVRNASKDVRWRLKPLLLGLGSTLLFDLFYYSEALLFGRLDPLLWAGRAWVQLLIIPLLAVAAVRNRSWSIDVGVSRGVVFHSTAILAVGSYLLVMAAAGYYVQLFGGDWGQILRVALFFGTMVLLGTILFSHAIQARLKVFIAKNFFSFRYDYREEWLRVTNLLAKQDASAEIGERVLHALADVVESPGGALWMRDDARAFRQSTRLNFPRIDTPEPHTGPLMTLFQEREWIVDLNARTRMPISDEIRGLARLADRERRQRLAGDPACSLVNGSDRLRRAGPTARADRGQLGDAGPAEEHCASGRRAIWPRSGPPNALLEASKFDAFNRMSAFIVHDLKNLASQLSLMLRNVGAARRESGIQGRHAADRASMSPIE